MCEGESACACVCMKTTDGREGGRAGLSLLKAHTSECTVSFHLEKSFPVTVTSSDHRSLLSSYHLSAALEHYVFELENS